jgi:hypothetical protein
MALTKAEADRLRELQEKASPTPAETQEKETLTNKRDNG